MSLLKYQKTQWTKSVSGILPVGVICLFLVLISTSHMFCLIIPEVDYSPITFSFASYLLNLLISFFVTFSFVQLIFSLVFFFLCRNLGEHCEHPGSYRQKFVFRTMMHLGEPWLFFLNTSC